MSDLRFTGQQMPRERRAPRVLRSLPALIPLLPILAGLLIAGGGSGTGSAASAMAPLRSQPPTTLRNAAPSALPGGPGTLTAYLTRPVTLRADPNGRAVGRIGLHTPFGSPQVLWVRAVRAGWIGVVSSAAGNGRLGWMPAAAATFSRTDWQIRVSLATRELTVIRDSRTLAHYQVAIGRPDAPTPTGAFAVTDLLRTADPAGPYGCCILALSAHAPHAIQGWGGGDRIAIHSTPETATIGQPVSHGCVRLTLAEGRWLLDHIPLATPVLISSA